MLNLSQGSILTCFSSSCIISNNYISSRQAFALGGNSMLALLPRKNLKKISKLGSFESAFALERHPAFTGMSLIFRA